MCRVGVLDEAERTCEIALDRDSVDRWCVLAKECADGVSGFVRCDDALLRLRELRSFQISRERFLDVRDFRRIRTSIAEARPRNLAAQCLDVIARVPRVGSFYEISGAFDGVIDGALAHR